MFKFALLATVSALTLKNTTKSPIYPEYPADVVHQAAGMHNGTMAWADGKWAAQNAGVSGQQGDDVWRNNGPKAAWGQAPNPQPPHLGHSATNP